ncbi:MAG: protein jag [Terriglobales bacterium]
MALQDKIESAKKIDALLRSILSTGRFRLRYRITVDPPLPEERDWERPTILVEFSGPDSGLLLERNAELLRALEHLSIELLRLGSDEHEKVAFDCMNHRAMRLEELRLSAGVAAERVRKTGAPYEFSPMSSRERRVIHLALRDEPDLKTESQGEAGRRHVVVLPRNYKPKSPSPTSFRRR